MTSRGIGSLVAGLLMAGAVHGAPAYVWIEGERPAYSNFTGTTVSQALLSDGKWLAYVSGAVPKGRQGQPLQPPLEVGYAFDVASAGEYQLWMRLGYETVRAPLEWKLDDGAWTPLPTDRPTTSLMELWTFCEVAWVKAGDANLRAGKHSLQLRCTHPGPDGRVLIGLDCLAFVAGQNWTPEGKLKPGEGYDEDIDRQAAAQVFPMPDRQLAFTPVTSGRPSLPSKGEASRVVVALSGPWQVARYDDPDMDAAPYEPVQRLPAPDEYALRWRGVVVPGDPKRPELVLGHRLLYRTRAAVPAALQGRGFYLHFEGTSWIVSVFVNGQYAGSNRTVSIPWDIDVTRYVKPGEENAIVLAVKDGYYAIDPKSAHKRQYESLNRARNLPSSFIDEHVAFVAPVFPTGGADVFGWIAQPIAFAASGSARVTDVFVRTSVAEKRIEASVTLTNVAAAAASVEVRGEVFDERTGLPAKALDTQTVTLEPGAGQTVTLGADWADAKLWWPSESMQDKPDCYVLRTTILRDGRPVDVNDQCFGFREITIRGRDILVNGIPWHFWEFGYGLGAVMQREGPEAWLTAYHTEGNRWFRTAGSILHVSSRFESQTAMLEFFDREGIPLRWDSPVNGMFATFDLTKDIVWRNIEENLRAFVTRARNHPSVFMYSLENELMFINARLCFVKAYEQQEDRFAALCRMAKEIDPTRFGFGDGAGDLRGQCAVNCQHYHWVLGAEFPTSGYDFPTKRPGEDAVAYRKRTKDLYAWDGGRPLIGGEEFFYAGNLGAMAWIGGPDVYRGKSWADRAAGRLTEIACQGTRWQDVAAVSPGVEDFADAATSFRARAVFVREWNACFFAGSELTRTLKVFNDGRASDPLTLDWKIVLDGREAAGGHKTYRVAAGDNDQDLLRATLPISDRRLDGELRLTLSAGGKTVFEDAKPMAVLPRSGAVPGLISGALAVFDPEGSVRKWLAARRQEAAVVNAPDAIPASARVILIGKDAVTAQNRAAVSQAVKSALKEGQTVIVLEQQAPLVGNELPLAGIAVAGEKKDQPARPEFRAAGGQVGCIAFPVGQAHAVFRDLTASDFFTWSGDELVFRLSYATPASGAIALLQGGDELGLTPMMEIPSGTGSVLLSQALVATKLFDEPAADRLLYNALVWAANRAAAPPGKTLVISSGDAPFVEFLRRTGLAFATADSIADALAGDATVLVIEAVPSAVAELAAHADQVRTFCAKGRWIMLCGMNAAGLTDFDKLTGIEHRLRPFQVEAVSVRERADPLLMGLTDRDFSMYSDAVIAAWKNLYWVSSNVFSSVVDASDEDVASFARFRSKDEFKTVNGLKNDDFWQYILYLNAGEGASSEHAGEILYAFDKPESFKGLDIWSTPTYYAIKDIELVFDGKDSVPLTLTQTKEMQEFVFPPRKASQVLLRVKTHYPGESKQNLVEIDHLCLLREVPAQTRERAVMLTHAGGLVKYPMGSVTPPVTPSRENATAGQVIPPNSRLREEATAGPTGQGGILLNQVDWREAFAPQADPRRNANTRANVQKKLAIFGNLLRNMGAAFQPPAGGDTP